MHDPANHPWAAQLEAAATAPVIDELGQGVGDAPGADVVDEGDGVLVAESPAAVDDLLTAALHLGVVALHAREIEVFAPVPARDRAGGAASEPDEHCGTAEDDEVVTRFNRSLADVSGTDVADAAREHDRLVVAAEFRAARAGHLGLVGAEVTAERGAAELVVEGSAAQGAIEHNLRGRREPGGPAAIGFPRAHRAGETEVGDGEADEPRLGFGAAAGRTLVADFTARARGGTGEWGNRGRVIVGLDLTEEVDFLVALDVPSRAWIREEAAAGVAREHRGVVLVGREDPCAVPLVGVADHLEQGAGAGLTVDLPGGVKDFVPAVLRIGLRKHHQLHVVRVAAEVREGPGEVVDLVFREGESERPVGLDEGGAAARAQRDRGEGARLLAPEEGGAGLEVGEDHLCHPVVQPGTDPGSDFRRGRSIELQGVLHDPLQPAHAREAAVAGDVGRLGRPGRKCARAGPHHEGPALAALGCAPGPVGQEPRGEFEPSVIEWGAEVGEVHELGRNPVDRGARRHQVLAQFLQAERGEGGGAAENQHGRRCATLSDRAGTVKAPPARIFLRGGESR